MMKYLVVCAFAAYIGKSWSLPTTLTCPECMHISYQLINIPSELVSSMRDGLESELGQYNNVKCAKGTVPQDICPPPGYDKVSTCDTMSVKVRAIGIKAANLPASGVEFVVVTRSCGSQARETADLCTSIQDQPGEATNDVMNQFSQMKTLFDSVRYDGQFCHSTTGNTTAMNTVPKSTKDANPGYVTYKANPVYVTYKANPVDVTKHANHVDVINNANPDVATFWTSMICLLCVMAFG